MPESIERTPLAEDETAGATALVVIDMLSNWDFPDGAALLQQAVAIAPRIVALKARCRRAGVAVVYANDNRGRWRSDLRQVVAAAIEVGGDAAGIADQLAPQPEDYFVLKPKHSAFHETPLDLLLRHLKAERLILVGVTSDQCVLYTAADARMHDYEVVVPRDCTATLSRERNERALQHLTEVLNAATPRSADVALPGTPRDEA